MTTYTLIVETVYEFEAQDAEEARKIAADLDWVEDVGGKVDETSQYLYTLDSAGVEIILQDWRRK